MGLVAKYEMRSGKIMYPEEPGGAPNNRQCFKVFDEKDVITFL